MATPRKRYFRVADSVLREGWDDATLARLVRLMAYLNQRWARDGLTASGAGDVWIPPADCVAIAGTASWRSSRDALVALPERSGVAIRASVERRRSVLGIHLSWPRFVEFQGFTEHGAPEVGAEPGDESAPSASASRDPRPRPASASRDSGRAPPEDGPDPPRAAERRRPTTEAPERLDDDQLAKLRAWARTKHPDLAGEVDRLAEVCLDHWRAKGERRADWPATVRTWIGKEAGFRRQRGGASTGRPSATAGWEHTP